MLVFMCRVSSDDYLLTLVQVLEPGPQDGETRWINRSLSIHWWYIQNWSQCEVIPLHSVIYGALLVADPKYKGDYFVIDIVDNSMYL